MSVIYSSSSIIPFSLFDQFKFFTPKYASSSRQYPFVCCKFEVTSLREIHSVLQFRPHNVLKSNWRRCTSVFNRSITEENSGSFDWEDEEDVDDTASPWDGAVIFRRSSLVTHVEYCTTLERLGLGKVSTEVSRSRASLMGLRVTKAVKDYPLGTPVQISIDVTRKKQALRLDGIVKTVITLGCNRCGEPAAEPVFSNFSLLLTGEPIEEPDVIDMGVVFGKETSKSFAGIANEDEQDEKSIELDDRLYFPRDKKEIDISKNIRDLVHLEITINAVCDPSCKGLCLECGTNLNTSSCTCSKKEVAQKTYGPLKNLRSQLRPN